MERNQRHSFHGLQQNNTLTRHQYSSPMPNHHPAYALPLQYYPRISSSPNLSSYGNRQERSYGHETGFIRKPVVVSHGNNIYRGCYQRISTHQMQPHQQFFAPAPAPSSSYGHQRQYSNSGSINQELSFPVRFLSIDEHLTRRNNPAFQLVDGVIVLPEFPPASPFDIENMWLASKANTNSPAPDAVDVSDETVEANLNTKIYTSSSEASSSDEEHDICVVCQDEYQNKEKIGALCCGHEYHVECIRKWLRKKNVCAICKATAFPIEL